MSKNRYRQASFATSAHDLQQLLPDEGLEVAFAGRSNAGKSSVINTLTGQNRLAKISKTPGRTQLINFFPVEENARLVDLPGYGYAKVPESVKMHWARTLEDYFQQRQSLTGVVLIVDIRRGLLEFDLQMLHFCAESDLAVHVLLNKSDKLSFSRSKALLQTVKGELGEHGQSVQLFSCQKNEGLDELVEVLDGWFEFS